MYYSFRVEGGPISPAQAIKLSKSTNIFHAIVRCEVMFTDTAQSGLSYAREIEKDYSARIVDVHIPDIVEDMNSSMVLATSSRTTYIRFIRVSKTIIKNEGVLPHFRDWARTLQ